jgi:hypothetical protein
MSRADWKRSAGFFSRQWRMIRSTPVPAPGLVCDSSAGSSLRMALVVSAAVSRRNVCLPDSIS